MTMTQSNRTVPLLGYASGIGAANPACCMGPFVIKSSPSLSTLKFQYRWVDELMPDQKASGLEAIPVVARLSNTLAQYTRTFVEASEKFVVLGGDHTSAIGTWSGAACALQGAPLGLLWFDAHMDSHTPDTSLSQNVHGMPLAVLLGKGVPALTTILGDTPKLQPENVALIGVRDYEAAEAHLLNQLNVKVYSMAEIHQRGLKVVIEEALERVTRNTKAFGISFDVDVLDPRDAPATGCPVPGGISVQALLPIIEALSFSQRSDFLGLDLTEFLPPHDHDHKTERFIFELLNSMMGAPV